MKVSTRLFHGKSVKVISMTLVMVLFTIAVFGMIDTNTTVSAKSISDLEKEIAALENANKTLNNSLKNLSGQIENEEEKLEMYEKNIKNTEQQIVLYNKKIAIMQKDISVKQAELDAKEAEIKKNEDLFAQRVRAMYIAGSTSVLTTLLEARNFSDFLTRAELLKRISKSDQELINTLSKQRNEIAAVKAEMESQNHALQATKAQLDEKSKNLVILKQQSEATQAQLKARYERYFAELDKNKKKIDEQKAELARIIAERSGGGAAPEGQFKWPVPSSSRITSPFGWRTIFGRKDFHTGIDIGAPSGTTIVAAHNGKVISVKYQNYGYGYNVIVDHGGGYVTLYAHCSRIDVKEGDVVARGQAIAAVGTTGNSTGNHLHFEVRVNGKQMNPMNYVRKP